jgi:molecular chaperone DnaK
MEGEAVVIPNAEGRRTTPSIIAFVEGERLKWEILQKTSGNKSTKQLLLLNVLWDILLLKSQTKQKSFLQSSKGDNNTPRVDIDGRHTLHKIVSNDTSKNENC